MSFIGIIANSKSFDGIKQYIFNNHKNRNYQIFHINSKSIENIKNIKFDVVIITCPFDKILPKKLLLEKILLGAKYIVLNADIFIPLDFLKKEKLTVITYGLNQKSTVTISSITEEKVLIALQRGFKNYYLEEIELGEKTIILDENHKLFTQDILVIAIIFLIFSKNNL